MLSHYDYLVVGSGLFGSVFASQASKAGKKVLVLEKRRGVGGNISTVKKDGITVHTYGAHIFHTSDEEIWSFVTNHVRMKNFINSPIAYYKGEVYNMPFNMNTFSRMWNISTPLEARKIIEEQRKGIEKPTNLEEMAISLVGRDIYTKLVKDYTEKQWGRPCRELPPEIIKRLPVRFTYDNNYFNDKYQGIPEEGYTALVEKLLESSDVITGEDYLANRSKWDSLADKTLYTGCLDALYGEEGALEYRSLKFEEVMYEEENRQGVAVVNHTSHEVEYTRSIEHKHFLSESSPVTWISYEYPMPFEKTKEPYYPVNDEKNQKLYATYKERAEKDGILIGGRLAEYKYYDMDKTIRSALDLAKKVL